MGIASFVRDYITARDIRQFYHSLRLRYGEFSCPEPSSHSDVLREVNAGQRNLLSCEEELYVTGGAFLPNLIDFAGFGFAVLIPPYSPFVALGIFAVFGESTRLAARYLYRRRKQEHASAFQSYAQQNLRASSTSPALETLLKDLEGG